METHLGRTESDQFTVDGHEHVRLARTVDRSCVFIVVCSGIGVVPPSTRLDKEVISATLRLKGNVAQTRPQGRQSHSATRQENTSTSAKADSKLTTNSVAPNMVTLVRSGPIEETPAPNCAVYRTESEGCQEKGTCGMNAR